MAHGVAPESKDGEVRATSHRALPATRRARWWKRRVPVVLQATATECGAACLAMILSYHRRPTRVTECRGLFGSGRDGIRARAIVEAARYFGLRARAFSLGIDHLNTIP